MARRFALAGLPFVGGRTDERPMAAYSVRSPGNATKASSGASVRRPRCVAYGRGR
jgi:hypothetical protein